MRSSQLCRLFFQNCIDLTDSLTAQSVYRIAIVTSNKSYIEVLSQEIPYHLTSSRNRSPKNNLGMSLLTQPHVVPKPCSVVSIEYRI